MTESGLSTDGFEDALQKLVSIITSLGVKDYQIRFNSDLDNFSIHINTQRSMHTLFEQEKSQSENDPSST